MREYLINRGRSDIIIIEIDTFVEVWGGLFGPEQATAVSDKLLLQAYCYVSERV